MATHQDRLLRAPRSEPGGEYAGGSAAIRNVEIHLRHPELRALDGDREIERERQRPSAADRIAVDRANRDLIEMRQHVERPADQARPSFKLAHAAAALARNDWGAGRGLEHRGVRSRAE